MSTKTLTTQIKQRIDTTANWDTNSSTVLANGELGLERTTSGAIKIKVGDGLTTWTNLPYVSTGESNTNSGTQVYEKVYEHTLSSEEELETEITDALPGYTVDIIQADTLSAVEINNLIDEISTNGINFYLNNQNIPLTYVHIPSSAGFAEFDIDCLYNNFDLSTMEKVEENDPVYVINLAVLEETHNVGFFQVLTDNIELLKTNGTYTVTIYKTSDNYFANGLYEENKTQVYEKIYKHTFITSEIEEDEENALPGHTTNLFTDDTLTNADFNKIINEIKSTKAQFCLNDQNISLEYAYVPRSSGMAPYDMDCLYYNLKLSDLSKIDEEKPLYIIFFASRDLINRCQIITDSDSHIEQDDTATFTLYKAIDHYFPIEQISSSGGSGTDEIYVGTSAPESGHGYTMWINPNGDELEVSGTYDINFVYENTDETPFENEKYAELEYYLSMDEQDHSLLMNPETGCHVVYDDDWETVLAKYKAGQTLVFNLSVNVYDNIITWKIPLLMNILNDNDEGIFMFAFNGGEYVYIIQITPAFGIENAEAPYLTSAVPISSMPEVDDETITIDETTGKLRTMYGDYLGETEITWAEFENIDTSEFQDFTFEQNSVTYTLKAIVSTTMLEHSPWQSSTLSTITAESNNDDFSLTAKQKITIVDGQLAYTLSSIGLTVAGIIIAAAMSNGTYSDLDSDDQNLIQAIDWSQGTFAYAEVPSQNMCLIILSEEFYNNNITKITVTCPKDQYATINLKALDLGEGLFVDNNSQLSCSYGKHITSSLNFDTLERFATLKFNSTSPNTTAMPGYYTFFGDNNYFEANPGNITRFSSSQFNNELVNFILNGSSRKVYFTGIPMKNLNPETIDDYIELELQPITNSTIVSKYENLGWISSGIPYPQLFAAIYGTNNTLDEIISGTMTTATGYDYSFAYILAVSLSGEGIGNTILTNDENFVTTINGLDDQTSNNEDNYMQIYWGVEKTSYDMLPIKGLPNIGGIDNGQNNLIIGQNNEILNNDSEDNIIIGNKNKLLDATYSRDNCIFVGEGLYPGQTGQKIFGKWNIPLDAYEDTGAFIIGSDYNASGKGLSLTDPDGNTRYRYNPLVLRSNGNLYIGGNIYTNTIFTAGSSFTNNYMISSNMVVTRSTNSSINKLSNDAAVAHIITKINDIIDFLSLNTTFTS